jgi:hypothetical protein
VAFTIFIPVESTSSVLEAGRPVLGNNYSEVCAGSRPPPRAACCALPQGKNMKQSKSLFYLGRDREWAMAREVALVANLRKSAFFKH